MGLENISIDLVKQWGPSGLVLLFSIWMLRTILTHFLEKDSKKDEQVMEMGKSVAVALNLNTQTISQLKDTMCILSLTTQKMVDKFEWLGKMVERSDEDHQEILNHVQRAQGGRR